ncbi:DUF4194 domain-containing protein [Luteimonas sp. MHLX1A]|uniref:DUF4194 domain-containing protein n=1 Tax=Alterluteimonas muca TaxID=2878684 RepID=UPI001E39E155|nr:DUF4194 domain-containing protein [Luteimonas sp. MHLX1A]MCD9047885.1 DUF4194 domain-containing protein [Luteimonas sp. MHLX1A]
MVDPASAAAAPVASLFPSDTGTLALDARLALCKLLTGPYIDQDSPHWPALLRDEAVLRSRLSDVFLELVLDRDRKVAFTRQADTGELDTPILLRSTPLSYLESVLLLHLRQVLVDAENQGLRAAVDESEIVEHLELYTPAGGDRVAAAKRISAAIDKMRKNTILQAIRGAERRYEVSPTLRLLFNADDVEAMAASYRALAGAAVSTEDEDVHAID